MSSNKKEWNEIICFVFSTSEVKYFQEIIEARTMSEYASWSNKSCRWSNKNIIYDKINGHQDLIVISPFWLLNISL